MPKETKKQEVHKLERVNEEAGITVVPISIEILFRIFVLKETRPSALPQAKFHKAKPRDDLGYGTGKRASVVKSTNRGGCSQQG